MKLFQKIFASLFLATLLFALSGKTIHVISESGHEHDFICSESSTHFHEQEHGCFICDFELQLSDGYTFDAPELKITSHTQQGFLNSFFFVFSEKHFNFTSRGPPVA